MFTVPHDENEIAKIVVDCAYKLHVAIGPGLLESAYQAMLAHDLRKRGLDVALEVPIPIIYDGVVIKVAYRADMIINDLVILELKSTKEMRPVYGKQVLTYIRLAEKRLGILLNFGMPRMRDGIKRVIN